MRSEIKGTLRDWLLAGAVLLMESAWPGLFQYVHNVPEARLQDALLFAGIYLGVGALLYLLCLPILRTPLKAVLPASLGLFLVMNFGLLQRALKAVLPGLRGRWILLLAVLLLLALAGFLRRWKKSGRVLCQLLCLFLVVQYAFMLASLIPGKRQDLKTRKADTEADLPAPVPALPAEERPNVYYYIYDEYAGPVCLDHYYGETDRLYPELEQRGFSCSMSSYNTESCETIQLLPDLFDLSYDAPPYFVSGDGRCPRLYQIFSQMGYQINLINHMNFLDTDGANNLTPYQQEDSICATLYENSIFPDTPLAEKFQELPQLADTYSYRAKLQDVLEKMEHPEQYTGDAPTLTLGYVQMPHIAFVYDGAGNEVHGQADNWGDPQYYLGQLEYTRKHILRFVDSILAQDPGAVIILQSDHGARLAYHRMELYGQPYDAEEETPYMQSVLNCVYAGGNRLEIEGKTGVNTLVSVLNAVFGLDLPEVPPAEGYVYDPAGG